MEFAEDRPLLHIGELSRRLGGQRPCAPGSGKNRYGLLQPVRSPGGFRLYSEADQWRIRQMQAYLAGGLSAAEAARAALSSDASTPPGRPAGPPLAAPAGNGPCAAFRQALDVFDEPAAQGRAGPCRTGCSPICPCRPSCGMSCCPTSLTSASAGSARQPAWPWSIRQQSHPRPARGADPWLGEQARPAGPARLPPGAARYGADGFRHLYSTATAGGSAISERASRSRSWSGPPAPRVLTPTASSPASSPGTGTSSTR